MKVNTVSISEHFENQFLYYADVLDSIDDEAINQKYGTHGLRVWKSGIRATVQQIESDVTYIDDVKNNDQTIIDKIDLYYDRAHRLIESLYEDLVVVFNELINVDEKRVHPEIRTRIIASWELLKNAATDDLENLYNLRYA